MMFYYSLVSPKNLLESKKNFGNHYYI